MQNKRAYVFLMKDAWSPQGLLKMAVSLKLMSPEQEKLWSALIDVLDEQQSKDLWTLFQDEMKGYDRGLSSMDAYRAFRSACSAKRRSFLEKLLGSKNADKAAAALLEQKPLWTEKKLSDAFADDEKMAAFLGNLSVEELEAMRASFEELNKSGAIDRDGYASMTRLITEILPDAWEREKEAAERLKFMTDSLTTAMRLTGLIERLKGIQSASSTH